MDQLAEVQNLTPEIIPIVSQLPELTREIAAVMGIVEEAQEMTVSNQQEFDAVQAIAVQYKARYDFEEARRVRLKAPILEAGKGLDAEFKIILDPLKRAYEILRDGKLKPWQLEQERIERERQAAAEALAEKEIQRVAALAAENERKAQEARDAGDEKKAEKYEQKAAIQAETAATIRAPVIQPTFNRGSSTIRQNWKGEGKDLIETVRAAAGGNAMALGFLMYDEQAINKQAKASKDAIKVPGVRFFNDPSMAVGKK